MPEERDYIKQCGVCIALIAINCVLSVIGFFSDDLFYALALIPERVMAGEYYRIVTAMFLHGDLTHLLSNMIGIYCMGQILEVGEGHVKGFLIYMLAGIGASLAIVLTANPDPQTLVVSRKYVVELTCAPDTLTIGASGAIFGLMPAALYSMYRKGDGFRVRGILINLVLNLYSTFTVEGISVMGHIGGLIAGAIVSLILIRDRKDRGPDRAELWRQKRDNYEQEE